MRSIMNYTFSGYAIPMRDLDERRKQRDEPALPKYDADPYIQGIKQALDEHPHKLGKTGRLKSSH
jgi:hypothetical protein